MNALLTTLAVLLSVLLLTACASPPAGQPIASRPSITIFPVRMAGQPREDVAALVAMMLEQRGLGSIEVADTAFTPEPGAAFDEQAEAFGRFVRERSITTEYAHLGSVLGAPGSGVDEISSVLADRDGHVVWTDRQMRGDRALRRAKPTDPMTSTMFLVERLAAPLDLRKPRRGAGEGRWAQHWRSDSLAPDASERDAMQARLAALRNTNPARATVIVFPARVGDAWSGACARRLTDAINQSGLMNASVANEPLAFSIEPSRNQQRVLWSGARSIRELVRANPPRADYVLVADYMVAPDGAREALGVHTFLLDASGEWIIVDFQNAHHDDFRSLHPRSLEECCDLSVLRLGRQL